MRPTPTERATAIGAPAPGPLRTAALVSGLLVVVLGGSVMIGWALNIELLKQVTPSLVSMKFNTALCLALLGVGIAAGGSTRVARAASLAVLAIATVSFVEFATGWKAGIDQLVFRDAGAGGNAPGRMAMTTAICLCLGGAALYALRAGRRRSVTGLTLTMLAIGWLACLGYLFGVQELYRVSPFSTMAGHTAVAVVILGVGLLASTPGGLLPWIVRGDDPGATVLRAIVPAAFIGLPLVAEIRLMGQHAGWYGTEFGLAIMVVVSSTSLAAVSVFGARVINRSHAARLHANDQLRDLNTNLEARIEERTTELATSEAWSRALAGSAPVGIFRTDENGQNTYVNDRYCEIHGVSADEALSVGWQARLHDDDRVWVHEEWTRSIATGVEFDAEFRLLRPTGGVSWLHVHGVQVLGLSGGHGGHAGTVADITSGREAAHALREAEELFRTSFESSPVGIALVDGYGRVVRANQALCELTGYSADELVTMKARSLHNPDADAGEQGETGWWAGADQRIVRTDGSVRWAAIRYAQIQPDSAEDPILAVAQFVDTTERRRFEERLAHTANHDPLTGLMNRRSFEVVLATHVSRCRRYGAAGAVLMLDLDHFKEINDTHGHGLGDEVLISTADRLRHRLRESDLIARLGGDEFVILLPVGGVAEARAVAQSVVEAIRLVGPPIAGNRVAMSASIGIAVVDGVGHSPEELLANADAAMYDAKELGGDRWAEFATDGPTDPAPRPGSPDPSGKGPVRVPS